MYRYGIENNSENFNELAMVIKTKKNMLYTKKCLHF